MDCRAQSLLSRFTDVHVRLAETLEAISDAEAECVTPESAWTAAQIGYHVGTVDIGFSRVLDGRVPGIAELPSGHQRRWADIARDGPRMEAPENVRPPARVSRAGARGRLQFGGEQVARVLSTLTPDRGERLGWTHPLLGLLSLYELGEWLISHTAAHSAQLSRIFAAARPTFVRSHYGS